MDMIKARNLSSHTYNPETAEESVENLSLFTRLNHAELKEHIERVGVIFYTRRSCP